MIYKSGGGIVPENWIWSPGVLVVKVLTVADGTDN